MTDELKKEWIEEQRKQIQLVNPNIIPTNPIIGFFFKVNGIEIPENLFKEEFDVISSAYFSVLEKLNSEQIEG